MIPSSCPKCGQSDIKAIKVVNNIITGPEPYKGNKFIILGILMFIPVFVINNYMGKGIKFSTDMELFFIVFFILGVWLVFKGARQNSLYKKLSSERDIKLNLYNNGWTCLRCGLNWIPNDKETLE
jgi:hypothetical protein